MYGLAFAGVSRTAADAAAAVPAPAPAIRAAAAAPISVMAPAPAISVRRRARRLLDAFMALSLWPGRRPLRRLALRRDECGSGRATRWHTFSVADGRRVTGHFVGRLGQLQVLDDALDRAQAGAASLVVVSGEAGIGKTWFCREVAGRAGRRGFAVGWGACWARGGAPPP